VKTTIHEGQSRVGRRTVDGVEEEGVAVEVEGKEGAQRKEALLREERGRRREKEKETDSEKEVEGEGERRRTGGGGTRNPVDAIFNCTAFLPLGRFSRTFHSRSLSYRVP